MCENKPLTLHIDTIYNKIHNNNTSCEDIINILNSMKLHGYQVLSINTRDISNCLNSFPKSIIKSFVSLQY